MKKLTAFQLQVKYSREKIIHDILRIQYEEKLSLSKAIKKFNDLTAWNIQYGIISNAIDMAKLNKGKSRSISEKTIRHWIALKNRHGSIALAPAISPKKETLVADIRQKLSELKHTIDGRYYRLINLIENLERKVFKNGKEK